MIPTLWTWRAGLGGGGGLACCLGFVAAGPVRPAVHCPAAGEGPRCRRRRSAVKLKTNDYVRGVVLSYCWQRTRFRVNQRHIREWHVGPYNHL